MSAILYSTPDQIQSLIDNEVAEGKNLEYKFELPGGSREERVEFLADVSSFSNTSGGSILYGILSENGVAIENPGIENQDLDQAILRMENMIRDSISPRITGIQIMPVAANEARSVLVMSIPKSFNSPHVVDFQGHWRIYGRNSAGKYQLDIGELRTAFEGTQNRIFRIRDFRAQRLLDIKSQNTPVRLLSNGRISLHLLPMEFLEREEAIDLGQLTRDGLWIHRNMVPINGAVTGHRYNMDGYLTFSHSANPALAGSYVQIFRNGIVEAVDSTMLQRQIDGHYLLPSLQYEQELKEVFPRYLQLLSNFGINLPILCMISLTDVRGYVLGISQRLAFDMDLQMIPLDRNDLLIPEVLIQSFDTSPDEVLKPIFDAIWNAFGFLRSFNYNAEGNWDPR